MNKIVKSCLLQTGIIYCLSADAGTPQLNLNCQSAKGGMTISGFPRGEGYDLSIKMGKAILRYVDICSDAACTKVEKQGALDVVEALSHNVFTIYFSEPVEGGALFMGYFYALPDTVKYTKTTRGYRAQYQALYDGADPRSNTSPRAFMENPVQLSCTQDEML